jgi:hypothetical protein
MERIGKLSFRRADSIGLGKQHCEVFHGKFENTLAVAIKRMQKKRTKVDSTFYLNTNGHPNIIQYFCTEDDDIEFMYFSLK